MALYQINDDVKKKNNVRFKHFFTMLHFTGINSVLKIPISISVKMSSFHFKVKNNKVFFITCNKLITIITQVVFFKQLSSGNKYVVL